MNPSFFLHYSHSTTSQLWQRSCVIVCSTRFFSYWIISSWKWNLSTRQWDLCAYALCTWNLKFLFSRKYRWRNFYVLRIQKEEQIIVIFISLEISIYFFISFIFIFFNTGIYWRNQWKRWKRIYAYSTFNSIWYPFLHLNQMYRIWLALFTLLLFTQ